MLPCTDIDKRCLQALYYHCLAEAEEITVARALSKKHGPLVVSGVALACSHNFKAASEAIKQMIRSLKDNQFGAWSQYLQFKTLFYRSRALCAMGEFKVEEPDVEKPGKKNAGIAICYFKNAWETYTKACEMGQAFGARKGFPNLNKHAFSIDLGKTIKNGLNSAESVNSILYYQRVPAECPPIIDARQLAKPIP